MHKFLIIYSRVPPLLAYVYYVNSYCRYCKDRASVMELIGKCSQPIDEGFLHLFLIRNQRSFKEVKSLIAPNVTLTLF